MPRVDMTHDSMRHYYRGRVFESTGELAIAIEEYRKAVELGADYADVHNSLGRTYAKKGLFEDAINEFNYALKLNSQYLEAQRNLDELEMKLAVMKKDGMVMPQRQVYADVSPKPVPPLPAARKTKKVYANIIFVAIGLLVGLSVVIIPRIIPKAKAATYVSPSTNITGMAYDGKTLWMCDWLKQEIYQCEVSKEGALAVKDTYHMPRIYPVGITTGDGYLWTCDAWSKKICQHVRDTNLTVIRNYDSPGDNPSGLCWDGKNIWSCDLNANKIFRHAADEKLSVKEAFPSPAEKLIGFFWDGKYYWSVDGVKGVLYRHNKDAVLSVDRTYTMDLMNKKIGAIFIDKKYVWVVFEGEGLITRYPRAKFLR